MASAPVCGRQRRASRRPQVSSTVSIPRPVRTAARFQGQGAKKARMIATVRAIEAMRSMIRFAVEDVPESVYDARVTSAAPDVGTVLAELEGANRLLVEQVFKPIANEYRISVPTPGSTEEGRPLLYVKQKRMKIKEDIRFRLSPDDEAHVFMIKSKTVFEFRGRHEVLDADGSVIGLLEKDFKRSLLRSHWHVRDGAGTEVLEAHEASWVVALIRRFADLGPDWASLLTWLPFNFVLLREGQEVGTYKRVLGKLRDRYVLELRPEAAGIDRRLILAFTIGLDALQYR